MSSPDWILCQYPLPNPELQEKHFDCEDIGYWQSELFIITKEGRIFGGGTVYDDAEGNFNLTGDLRFYCRTGDHGIFVYLAHFINGQLQSIRRPDLVEIDSPLNPNPHTIFYCEHLGQNDGTVFRITEDGRLIKPEATGTTDLHFQGDLKLGTAMYSLGSNQKYLARFADGQLEYLEKIEEDDTRTIPLA